jgi:hypothetical protein
MATVPVVSPCAPRGSCPPWQEHYLQLLPAIRKQAHFYFRHLKQEAREEAVTEVVANALVAFVRLALAGKQSLAYATPLARFGAMQYRCGRRVGSAFCATEVLSCECQRENGFAVESIDLLADGLSDDHNVTPADRAAIRLDLPAWLASLGARDRALARVLATGETTQSAAERFGLTAGRISQLRRQFLRSWQEFVGERPSKRVTAA